MRLNLEPSRIARSYRDADNKRKQLKILAELNACSVGAIASVLRRQGIDDNIIKGVLEP